MIPDRFNSLRGEYGLLVWPCMNARLDCYYLVVYEGDGSRLIGCPLDRDEEGNQNSYRETRQAYRRAVVLSDEYETLLRTMKAV